MDSDITKPKDFADKRSIPTRSREELTRVEREPYDFYLKNLGPWLTAQREALAAAKLRGDRMTVESISAKIEDYTKVMERYKQMEVERKGVEQFIMERGLKIKRYDELVGQSMPRIELSVGQGGRTKPSYSYKVRLDMQPEKLSEVADYIEARLAARFGRLSKGALELRSEEYTKRFAKATVWDGETLGFTITLRDSAYVVINVLPYVKAKGLPRVLEKIGIKPREDIDAERDLLVTAIPAIDEIGERLIERYEIPTGT
ncbi:MAG: hypothetical protein KGH66_02525 [Candidatus Micrarchaeota archaeon]|nr:hypothetical protein [Candidatus Micrarchaeota archaeon]